MRSWELRECAILVFTSLIRAKSFTVDLLADKGWHIVNTDATICAEQPKLNPHIPTMQATLAPLMDIEPDAVSIKATTTERLGFTGRQEGISAYAVALIEKS